MLSALVREPERRMYWEYILWSLIRFLFSESAAARL